METLLLVHRIVGYITVFIIGPLALLNFATPRVHRRWGKLFFLLICFLYLTGSVQTFLDHGIPSYDFARSLTFNFFGFSMAIYGYRAIHVMVRRHPLRPAALDWTLTAILALVSVSMLFVYAANTSKWQMIVFAVIGLLLAGIEVGEFLTAFDQKSVLFARHMRYMLASFFYVLTVLSLVHLGGTGKVKWLWPAVIGLPAILLTSRTAARLLGPTHGRALRGSIWLTLAATYGVGIVILAREFL